MQGQALRSSLSLKRCEKSLRSLASMFSALDAPGGLILTLSNLINSWHSSTGSCGLGWTRLGSIVKRKAHTVSSVIVWGAIWPPTGPSIITPKSTSCFSCPPVACKVLHLTSLLRNTSPVIRAYVIAPYCAWRFGLGASIGVVVMPSKSQVTIAP